MYLKTKAIEIELNNDDIETFESIAFSAIRGMEESIRRHYNNLQDYYERGVEHAEVTFLEQSNKEINMLQKLLDKVSYKRDVKKDLLEYLRKDFDNQHKDK